MESLQFLLKHGGVTAWLILILGVLLIVVGFERIQFLFFKFSFDMNPVLDRICSLIKKKEYTDALQVCNSTQQTPETMVIKAGLMAAENGREAMMSAIGSAVLNVSRLCNRRIPFIALVAAISTLLGLLGTISGLIKTFAALAEADATQKAQLLGNGISEAMYATGSGLILGIAAMCIHSVCTTKGEHHVVSSQDTGYKLVGWIEESERSKDV